MYTYVHVCFYMFTTGRTKACEQWLLLGSRVKNWETGGMGRRRVLLYTLCAFWILTILKVLLINKTVINIFKKREAKEKSFLSFLAEVKV